ncbi:hypothetical protein CKO15_06100 [Halorhodospira abdelmalekii]|uniref:ParB family protein n=1 Tax=Halorhodospira abdelmalekii TaxID=421629 RepID=UPI00190749A7|nr:ParB family protein [Halorhodospira abdelmalekii]MBK1734868.1 hypothetical protein [Halorhodospira abdelmalekii]
MAKQGLSEKVRQGLWQGYPRGNDHRLDQPGDPVTITQMVLSIDEIAEYEHNPRQQENPFYDEIKASICAQRGLSNSLEVTRRPGDERYIVGSGGNTRLRILRELYRETGDEAFARVHCLFRPWQGETAILANHLVENDLRGELALIDKALALQQLRARLESDHGEPLSRNAFIKRLHELGYTISKRQLIRHEFAAQRLLPAMPEALAKIGGESVDRLRQLYRGATTVWQHHGREELDFEPLWEQALASADGPEWDLEAARHKVTAQIAEALGTDPQSILFELDAALSGHPLPALQGENRADSDGTETESRAVQQELEHRESSSGDTQDEKGQELPDSGADSGMLQQPSTVSIPEYREQIYRLAHAVAKRYRLDRCVQSWDHGGLGYLVELPANGDIPAHTAEHWVWWTLLALSEAIPHLHQLPGDYELGHLMQHDPDSLRQRIGSPAYTQIAADFLSHPSISDADIQQLIRLIQLCRQLRQAAHERNIDLWEG